jgi:hypothetical protein
LQLVTASRDIFSAPWTTSDIRIMRANAHHGAAYLADLLGRSIASVRAQAKRQRISLRPPGRRSGTVIGQPRGVSWTQTERDREMREHVLARKFRVGAAERRIQAEVRGLATWCPRCTRRQVSVRMTGLCGVCHMKMLTEQHREEIEAIEAQRQLNRVKQQKKRLIEKEYA